MGCPFSVLPAYAEPTDENIARQAVASTDAGDNGVADKAIGRINDGVEGSNWTSAGLSAGDLPKYVTLDFQGRTAVLGKITLSGTWCTGGQAVKKVDVEVYDGSAWTPVKQEVVLNWTTSSDTPEYKDIVFDSYIQAKQIRIKILDAYLNWGHVTINEFKAWGQFYDGIENVTTDKNAGIEGTEQAIDISVFTSNISDGTEAVAELVYAVDGASLPVPQIVRGTISNNRADMVLAVDPSVEPGNYKVKVQVNGMTNSSNVYSVLGNLALDAIASTDAGDSGEADKIIGKINDGMDGSNWTSATLVADNLPKYVVLDFGAKRVATGKITITGQWCTGGQAIKNIDIQYFNGNVWVTAASDITIPWATNSDIPESQDIPFSTVHTNRLRIKINDAFLNWEHITVNELKVLGTYDDVSISSVDNISDTVFQGDAYVLPDKAKVKMTDGSTMEVPVVWNPGTADTSVTGVYTFTGTITGYPNPVNLTLTVSGVSEGYINARPSEDTASIIKNPGMGWVLYIDQFAQGSGAPPYEFPFTGDNAQAYWESQDAYASKAGIFYIRAPWSQFEPTEGQYAWIYDENYKALIQGALDRNLKLAFRVYVSSADSYQQATPEYVKQAGAQGFIDGGGSRWTPYYRDEVFQAKFEKFLDAFAEEYNNPDIVDYIDGMGLGWWGEMHHLNIDTEAEKNDVFAWITNAYRTRFTKVLLGASEGGDVNQQADNLLKSGEFDVLRRDSIGMTTYFPQGDKDNIASLFNQGIPVFAENGFHHFVGWQEPWLGNGYVSIKEMLTAVMNDAKYIHANTLDLRVPPDAKGWNDYAPELVDDFAINGGYRIVPVSVIYPESIANGNEYTISETWKNTGVGRLPNNRPGWDYKYKVVYALLDQSTGEPVYKTASNVEPSDWVKGTNYQYNTPVCFDGVPAGTYDFAVAIADRDKGYAPAINLAITDEKTPGGWYKLGETAVIDTSLQEDVQTSASVYTSQGTSNGEVYSIGDGDSSTAWSSSIGMNLPKYFEMSWGGKTVTADRITLVSQYAQSQGITNIDVEYYTGTQWKAIVKDKTIAWATDTSSPESHAIAFGVAVKTNKMRVKVNKVNSVPGYYTVSEIKVNGVLSTDTGTPVNVAKSSVLGSTMPTDSTVGLITNIIDGNGAEDLGWPWQTLGAPDFSSPQYITLDFINKTVITDRLRIGSSYGSGQGIKNIDVDYWNGGKWNSIVTDKAFTWTSDSEFQDVNFGKSVSCSKIRIKVNSANLSWGHLTVAEIQVIGYGDTSNSQTNVALDAQVSSTAGNTLLGNINDGNDGDSYASAGADLPQYITYDWGNEFITANKITVVSHWAQGQGITQFDLDYFDGSGWVSAKKDLSMTWTTNDDTDEQKDFFIDPITASKIRFKITGASTGWGHFAINELKVFGWNIGQSDQPPFVELSKAVNTVKGETVQLGIKRMGTAISMAGRYDMTLPEGWMLDGDGSFESGSDLDTLRIIMPEGYAGTGESINVKPIFNNVTLADLNFAVTIIDPVSVSLSYEMGEDGATENWSVVLDVKNNCKSTTLGGTVNISGIDGKSLNLGETFNNLPAGGTGTVRIPIPVDPHSSNVNVAYTVTLSGGFTKNYTDSIAVLMPAISHSGPEIDGTIDIITEWKDAVSFELKDQVQVIGKPNWSGTSDLSATGYIKWDEENLYLAVKVKDNTHRQTNTGDQIWNGDSLQFAIDPKRGSGAGHYEYGFALNGSEIVQWRFLAAYAKPTGAYADAECAITRNEDDQTTSYEVSIPFTELLESGAGLSSRNLIGFSLLVNDDDGEGRGYIQYFAGIGADKDEGKFGDLILIKRNESTPNPTPTPTSTPSPSANQPAPSAAPVVTLAQSHVSVEVEKPVVASDGKATAVVPADTLNRALADAKAGAVNSVLVIVPEIEGAKAIDVKVPLASIEAAEKTGVNAIGIKTGLAEISFNVNALKNVAGSNAADVTISTAVITKGQLSENVANIVGDRPVFDFNIYADGDKIENPEFKGDVSVSFDYTPTAGEDLDNIVVYYINDAGGLEVVKDCAYDPATGKVTFKPKHFSLYTAVVAKIIFNDLSAAPWSQVSVEALAARGLLKPDAKGNFEPGKSVTRKDFIKTLIETLTVVDETARCTFKDVEEGSPYYQYIATAQKLGITVGYGDGTFGADREISRQEATMMLYRAVSAFRIELPKTGPNINYTDRMKIDKASWPAVEALTEAGILSGVGMGRFAPEVKLSKAQSARILYGVYKLLQLQGG